MNVGQRIKQRRKELGLTADDVAEYIGKNRATIFRYEKGDIEKLPISILDDLSDLLKTSPEWLMGWSNKHQPNIVSIYNQLEPPRQEYVYEVAEEQLEEQNRVTSLYGGVAANPTELAYGDPVYDEVVTKNVPKGADGALTIHGDSMEDMFYDGDICFFKRQPDVENGEIAIVEINGEGVTCKKVIKHNGSILLRSLNDKYEDREIKSERIRIIGKVVK